MGPLAQWHTGLPDPLRALLSVGSVGKLHLLDSAVAGLEHATTQPDLARTSADMVLWAFGDSPLSGELAGHILASPILAQYLTPDGAQVLRTVSRAWRPPEDLRDFQQMVALREMERIKPFIADQVTREPDNLYWLEQAMNVGMYEADYDWLESVLTRSNLSDLGPVHHVLMLQLAAAQGKDAQAQLLAERLGGFPGPGYATMAQAQARLNMGDRTQGLGLLLKTLAVAPWQTQAALRAYDILEKRDLASAPLPGSVAILLYSWNKADDLDATLDSLARSELGEAVIYMLDNGSTDHTPEVLAAWSERMGQRLKVTTLPVNVGAAAARNWLMHLPGVRESDWAVYLDDDTLLPPDWLARLGAAAKLYPDAGVWGCKVVDAIQPMLMQSVDFHLMPGQGEVDIDLSNTNPHPILLSTMHIQVLDGGQFDYLRPCASVTGCCHLFKTSRLHEVGDFSLFLSPSQYDDMERDLRMNAAGLFAVYQGHLRVLHAKRTGRASLVETSKEANAIGNKYKMSVMHEPEEVAASTAREQELIKADLETKLARLDLEPTLGA